MVAALNTNARAITVMIFKMYLHRVTTVIARETFPSNGVFGMSREMVTVPLSDDALPPNVKLRGDQQREEL